MAVWYIDELGDVVDALRGAREDAGMSVSELVDNSGLPRSTIYKWEVGHSVPNLRGLLTLAQALGATFIINGGDSKE